MPRIELKKRGSGRSELTDKMCRFIAEFAVDGNGAQAAIRAGYPPRSAHVQACRLLKHPKVAAIVGKMTRDQQEELRLTRKRILLHLAACALRNGKDFVDKDGRLILWKNQNLRDLPDHVTCAIDSIKQKKRRYRDEEGNLVEEIETELLLTSKLKALEMAMKHKGMFAAEKLDARVAVGVIDWDTLFKQDGLKDPIEQQLILEPVTIDPAELPQGDL